MLALKLGTKTPTLKCLHFNDLTMRFICVISDGFLRAPCARGPSTLTFWSVPALVRRRLYIKCSLNAALFLRSWWS